MSSQIGYQSFQDPNLSQVSRTIHPIMMVMSILCHCDNICDFVQFIILLHNFIIHLIIWDVDNLLRDAYFIHIKSFNLQGTTFNLTIDLPLLHPILRKSLICNIETKKNRNEYFSSSIKESHVHDSLDFGQPNKISYDMYMSLFSLSCLSFPNSFFHYPIANSLEVSFQSRSMSHGLYSHAFCKVSWVVFDVMDFIS